MDGLLLQIKLNVNSYITLRWLPRVFTIALAVERKLEKETLLIYLKVFPVEIYQ